MTQEEKELLLKDLCGRLPYGVIIEITSDGGMVEASYDMRLDAGLLADLLHSEDDFKPYLRPMSSMTEEEGKELEHIFSEIDASCWVDTEYGCVDFAGGNDFIDAEMAEVYIDWLNKKMFDYRGLIEKGLAIEAPTDMYNN